MAALSSASPMTMTTSCPCGMGARVQPAGGWLELNATAAGQTLAPIPQGQDVLIVIGEGLDRARIETQLHR